ncbi:MAG: type II secretion system protein GspE, partial [Actinomycetota bacterium]
MRNLGQILVDRGLITTEQLLDAEQQQSETGRSLGRVLVAGKMVTEKDLVAALATQIGMEFVDLAEAEVDPRAATMIGDAIMRRHAVLPIAFEGGKLVVAMSDPSNVVAIDDLRTLTKMEIKPVVATKDDVLAAIGKYASMADDMEALTDEMYGGDDDSEDLASLNAVTEDAPIVKFVNLLISQ